MNLMSRSALKVSIRTKLHSDVTVYTGFGDVFVYSLRNVDNPASLYILLDFGGQPVSDDDTGGMVTYCKDPAKGGTFCPHGAYDNVKKPECFTVLDVCAHLDCIPQPMVTCALAMVPTALPYEFLGAMTSLIKMSIQ